MEIRPLKEKDFSALADFAGAVERGPHFNWDKESLVQGLKNWEIWATFENQKIVVALAGLAAGDQLELLWIQSLPQYRNQGLARELMQHWLNAARHKFATVILEVHAKNHSAQNLYRSLGFAHQNSRKKYYSDGSDAYIFCLNLSN
jgi:[ribosomal protein S18]-alanine N-acetyltransferase